MCITLPSLYISRCIDIEDHSYQQLIYTDAMTKWENENFLSFQEKSIVLDCDLHNPLFHSRLYSLFKYWSDVDCVWSCFASYYKKMDSLYARSKVHWVKNAECKQNQLIQNSHKTPWFFVINIHDYYIIMSEKLVSYVVTSEKWVWMLLQRAESFITLIQGSGPPKITLCQLAHKQVLLLWRNQSSRRHQNGRMWELAVLTGKEICKKGAGILVQKGSLCYW